MSNRMRVFAVVVNWNGGEDNLACVRSLLDQGLPPAQVVFVDNASRDGSTEAVEAAHPGLTVLRNERNLGYGHGNNRGIEAALEAGAEAVFLANNDLVLPPGALALLEAGLEARPELGIVGPRVLYHDDPTMVWAAGGWLTWRHNLTTLRGHREPDGPEWRRTLEVDFVPGAAMLVRRAVFERAGLLDGEYFAYHEDADFCLAATRAGYRVACLGDVSAWHRTHAATGGGYNPLRKYMLGVNTVWFLRRHGTPVRWLRFVLFDVVSLLPLLVIESFRGRGRAVLAKARGMYHGLRGRRVTAETVERGAGAGR